MSYFSIEILFLWCWLLFSNAHALKQEGGEGYSLPPVFESLGPTHTDIHPKNSTAEKWAGEPGDKRHLNLEERQAHNRGAGWKNEQKTKLSEALEVTASVRQHMSVSVGTRWVELIVGVVGPDGQTKKEYSGGIAASLIYINDNISSRESVANNERAVQIATNVAVGGMYGRSC